MNAKFSMVMFAIFFITFAVFFAVSVRNGAAVSGKIVDGHYYVGQHSNYKEVSRKWYIFTAVLTALIGLEIPVLAWSAIWFESRKEKQPIWYPVFIGGGLLSLIVGIVFFYGSIRCLLGAFSHP